jgi:hypothetical protein
MFGSDEENPGFILVIGLRLCEITLYIFLTAFGGKTLGMTDLPRTQLFHIDVNASFFL